MIILYLLPEKLVKYENKILELQKENIKTYFEKILFPTLEGNEKIKKLTLSDKVFSGIINIENGLRSGLISQIAPIWYSFTKTTHASLGPRIGKFIEKMIMDNIYGKGYTHYKLKDFFKEMNINIQSNSKIDYIIKRENEVIFAELRTSEHTGGKTGQESLMDKFVIILDNLSNEETIKKFKNNEIHEIKLIIGILYNENKELLNKDNYSTGRHNSLINYFVEDRHIGGKIKKLLSKGYTIKYENEFLNNYSEDLLRTALSTHRSILLKNDDILIEISILWGKEFINLLTNGKLDMDLEVGDDLWLFFTLTINEIKLKEEFGYNTFEYMIKYIESKKLDKKLYKELDNTKNFVDALSKIEKISNDIAKEFMEWISIEGINLKVLETNDIGENYNYIQHTVLLGLSYLFYKKYYNNRSNHI